MAIQTALKSSQWMYHEEEHLSLSLQGSALIHSRPCEIESFSKLLKRAREINDLVDILQRLNGFYAWVEQAPGRIRAAVDHIRSRPLFYACAGCRFYLSDDAEWVRQQVGDLEMDPVAREEFQLAGYVTGADTLFPNVKQLQAGEVLLAMQQGDSVLVETQRYYRFLHTEPDQADEPGLRARLDTVAVASMQRLIHYANGRQIVVPLSGGYDSRLIVTLLKRLGYDNLLTFTYGVPGNKESAYSKQVADALGLRWHFVEYGETLWRKAWLTPERWAYQKWASGWTSIAVLQDWLAVKILKEQGILEPDCLFVPGHTGDFISGGHIPVNAFERSRFTLNDATDAVFSKHYELAPLKFFGTGEAIWGERIRDRMEREGIETDWEYADVCEKWEWQERQAKFIGNSVRLYEFFGYDWWIPLWDKAFVEFWETVPLQLRKHKRWYNIYVLQQFKLAGGLGIGNAADRSNLMRGIFKAAKAVAKTVGVLNIVKRIYIHIFTKRLSPDILASSAWVAPGQDKSLIKAGFTVNGLLARNFIDSLCEEL